MVSNTCVMSMVFLSSKTVQSTFGNAARSFERCLHAIWMSGPLSIILILIGLARVVYDLCYQHYQINHHYLLLLLISLSLSLVLSLACSLISSRSSSRSSSLQRDNNNLLLLLCFRCFRSSSLSWFLWWWWWWWWGDDGYMISFICWPCDCHDFCCGHR
jgi:hypothetical protein